ncbi:hypothetical protein OG943_34700 [Amycolatopsis sp. NBC_00345]|uniref:hypothetical protein n=1 Tax=Amycolatopsis sp. NBC_00345 TaxID=2975955 RepID=UPI002E26D1DC
MHAYTGGVRYLVELGEVLVTLQLRRDAGVLAGGVVRQALGDGLTEVVVRRVPAGDDGVEPVDAEDRVLVRVEGVPADDGAGLGVDGAAAVDGDVGWAGRFGGVVQVGLGRGVVAWGLVVVLVFVLVFVLILAVVLVLVLVLALVLVRVFIGAAVGVRTVVAVVVGVRAVVRVRCRRCGRGRVAEVVVADVRGVRDVLELAQVVRRQRGVRPRVRPHHPGGVLTVEQQPVVAITLAQPEEVHHFVGEASAGVVHVPVELVRGRRVPVHSGIVDVHRHAAGRVGLPAVVVRVNIVGGVGIHPHVQLVSAREPVVLVHRRVEVALQVGGQLVTRVDRHRTRLRGQVQRNGELTHPVSRRLLETPHVVPHLRDRPTELTTTQPLTITRELLRNRLRRIEPLRREPSGGSGITLVRPVFLAGEILCGRARLRLGIRARVRGRRGLRRRGRRLVRRVVLVVVLVVALVLVVVLVRRCAGVCRVAGADALLERVVGAAVRVRVVLAVRPAVVEVGA